jgi:hypothetical protein
MFKNKIEKIVSKPVKVPPPQLVLRIAGDNQAVRFNASTKQFEWSSDVTDLENCEWEKMDWECWLGDGVIPVKEIRDSLEGLLKLLNATVPKKK